MSFVQNVFSKLSNLDYILLKKINATRTPVQDEIAKLISGSIYPAYIIAPIYELVRNGKQSALAMSMSETLQFAITQALKRIVHRPRPYITHPDINNLKTEPDASFTSGHTSTAFAIATSFLLNHPTNSMLKYIVFLYAFLMGYARMYMGVHYPLDAFVGSFVGIGSAFASQFLSKLIFKK